VTKFGLSQLNWAKKIGHGKGWAKKSIQERTSLLYNTLQHAATRCNTLQHAATHCNTLHATHCMQHTASKFWAKKLRLGQAQSQKICKQMFVNKICMGSG